MAGGFYYIINLIFLYLRPKPPPNSIGETLQAAAPTSGLKMLFYSAVKGTTSLTASLGQIRASPLSRSIRI